MLKDEIKKFFDEFVNWNIDIINNAKTYIDYVESEEFYVIVTSLEEHITLFKNQMEYMVVKDLEEGH